MDTADKSNSSQRSKQKQITIHNPHQTRSTKKQQSYSSSPFVNNPTKSVESVASSSKSTNNTNMESMADSNIKITIKKEIPDESVEIKTEPEVGILISKLILFRFHI